ncbi:MAG TPA: hypothetical protein PLU30_21770 [Verrucomicrobiae bacterium]|nr:hypothetical protein [Verrucomicrobiae bacterium]
MEASRNEFKSRRDINAFAVNPLLLAKPSNWRCRAVRRVAARFGSSTKTVRRNPGRFNGVRIGGRWRCSLDGIEAAAVPAKVRAGRGAA